MDTVNNTSNKVVKRKRTKLSLAAKLRIVQALDSGEKISSVAKFYNLSTSTIRAIGSKSAIIKKSVKEVEPTSLDLAKYYRNTTLLRMEKILVEWIKDNNRNKISMDTCAIRNQALLIFNELNNNRQEDEEGFEERKTTFVASKGWFEKFKKRYNLHNIKFIDESINEEGNIEVEVVHTFEHFTTDNTTGSDPDGDWNTMFDAVDTGGIMSYTEDISDEIFDDETLLIFNKPSLPQTPAAELNFLHLIIEVEEEPLVLLEIPEETSDVISEGITDELLKGITDEIYE